MQRLTDHPSSGRILQLPESQDEEDRIWRRPRRCEHKSKVWLPPYRTFLLSETQHHLFFSKFLQKCAHLVRFCVGSPARQHFHEIPVNRCH
ncbi:hypothetical protein Zmor_008255 [Zophobas morio]|uniref:Uncharacterized protein n=1 Tax=Zophobas morio TaxID=2755281 RepID=A0AA38IW46_9CUCU|nr:hypothetical protein Zmor_008255 [Zophobas morio]